MSSLNNSSKPMTWARPHRPWLPGSQQRSRARDACRRQLGAMTDLRCERQHGKRQLESAISRTAAAIATPPTISTNPRMLDSARIITPSPSRPCRRSLAVPQEVNQLTSPIEVNNIVSSLTTPLQQPASRDQCCCTTTVGTYRHPRDPRAGE